VKTSAEMLRITVLRILLRIYCAKMLRITWEVDGEYQQKSIHTFSNVPV